MQLKLRKILIIISIIGQNLLIAQSFVHPGILNTQAELEYVRDKVAINQDPWKSALDDLMARDYGKLSYTHNARENVSGSSQQDAMTRDGHSAYASALIWFYTGNEAYKNKAIDIINDWTINKTHDNDLYLGWAVPYFMNAAEILRYNNSGWSSSNINQLETMAKNIWLPILESKEERRTNNIRYTIIEAKMAIAVFTNDRTLYETAVNQWKLHVPSYIYLESDGNSPICPIRLGGPYCVQWGDAPYYEGQCLETCRDLNHVKLGAFPLFGAAEIAWKQGDDLWSIEKTRLKAFLEKHGAWMTGTEAVPSGICPAPNPYSQWGSEPNRLHCTGGSASRPPCNETAWEIAYRQLNGRLGMNLPLTESMLNNNRPSSSEGRRNTQFRTLTHANVPFFDNNSTDPVGPEGFTFIAKEREDIQPTIPVDIAYGADGLFNYLYNQRDDVSCTNGTFGDPAPGTPKNCFIKESKTSYWRNPFNVPGTLQAELYDYGGKNISFFDQSDENKGASESNFRIDNGVDIGLTEPIRYIGWIGQNEWTEYTMNITETGRYELEFHVASDNNNGRLGLDVNGNKILTGIIVPSTGGMDQFDTFTEEVDLIKGVVPVRIHYENGGFKFDKMVSRQKLVTSVSESVHDQVTVYPNPSSEIFYLSKPVTWSAYSIQGELLSAGNGKTIDLSAFPAGTYLLKANEKFTRIIKEQ